MSMGRRVLTCPHCGSADLYFEAGLITGQKYHCKRCDYIGSFVIEIEEENEEEGP
jgi:transposase-like protein